VLLVPINRFFDGLRLWNVDEENCPAKQNCRFREKVPAGGARDIDIDLLFISHFDADHISGLGMLLARAESSRLQVHTAIIQYLSPATGFAILTTAAV
jgi:glyoxylase-like metal-dependent hydrolase (beta-lactamase superfamily II)